MANYCKVCGQLADRITTIDSNIISMSPCGCTYVNDPVNHPKHYNNSSAKCACGRPIECIDITRHMGFCLGNAVKYIWRYADKNGLEDLKKAAWYLNDFIEKESKK